MITSEFEAAVEKRDLLMVRIMLKDSFVIDPSLRQFDEMFRYAVNQFPTLLVPYDEEPLEPDPGKWNKDTLDMELVKLVNNFSQVRIAHLKKVVQQIYAPYLKKQQTLHPTSKTTASGASKRTASPQASLDKISRLRRQQALKQMQEAVERISWFYQQAADPKNGWSQKNIDNMERSAKELLSAIRSYNRNK